MLAIVAALWLAFMAGAENIRFVHATDQVLRIVAVARDNAALYPWLDEKQATVSLIDRLSRTDSENVRLTGDQSLPQLFNPWNGRVDTNFAVAEKKVRVQTVVSPTICRRMIRFYGKDAASLGITAIDVQDEAPAAVKRVLYDVADKNARKGILPEAINTGCGQSGTVRLQLTFRLR